jgi:hypothetical protein
MKNIIAIAIQLLLCLNLTASIVETNPNNCDWTASNLNETLSLYDKVYSHLASGFWTKKSGEQEMLIQFYETGKMEWITYAKRSKMDATYKVWQLDFNSETPFLTLKKEGQNIGECFKLERNCDGIILTNSKTKERILLEKKLAVELPVIRKIERRLTGSWSNATYPFDISKNKNENGTRRAMKNAYLKIALQQDGTYFKKYGSEKVHLIEKGTWEISRDGQFILMKNNSQTSIAKIQHLDLDEMVIEWQLNHSKNTDFATGIKSFAFIR